MRDPHDIETDLGGRVQQLMQAEGLMVNRWFAAIEVINADGERWVFTATHPDSMRWDSLGLIEYAKAMELAAQVREDGAG